MSKNVLIGNAWPYANSSLHLGHIAGLMSGDLLARYHRLKVIKLCLFLVQIAMVLQ